MAHSARRDCPELPDFSLLKRLARDQLIYLLEQLPGKKDLFIEADLMSPLDRIANVSTLKQHEVDKLYKVEYKPVVSTSDQLCFLIRPRIQTVKWICDVANADKAVGKLRRYKIIFTPQKFFACEAVLEEQGIFGEVTTDEWSFYLLPLDEDVISLELPEFFRDTFLAGDQRWVRTAGSALHLLHSLYGPFSKVYGIGRFSKMAYESWREQVAEGEQRARQAEIGKVFLIDRDVDFVTPLCSQVVYEGLVDDIFRIKCGCVEFGPEVTSSDKSLKVMLNSQDKVFNEIRNEHFSNVFGFLSQKARNLQTAYDKRRGMDIKQMKTFVSEELKGLKQEHRLLSLHIGASESIMKKKTKQDFQELLKTEHSLLEGFEIRESISFLEEHISRQVSMMESLRLLCLLSITENGLLPKDYRSLKAQYLQSYGPDHLLTFANLRQLGLLGEQPAGETLTVMESKVGKLVNDKTGGKLTDAFSSLAKKSNFRALSRKLNLVPKSDEEYDLRVPRDMAYIFSGAYVPLSCKLVEQVLERDGWTGLEEVTRLLNGHEFAVAGSVGADSKAKSDAQRIILVMFLGGCTFSEISALRFLGREKGYKFIVVTTAITNSSRLIESLLGNQIEVLAAESVSCLNKALHHLKDIWEEIGIPEDQRLQRTNVVKDHIKGLLDRMIKEEESLKTRIIASIQICRTEMEKLNLELQLPGFEEETGITMLQQEKNIRTQVEALMTEKARRLQHLKALLDQDQDLCDILCSVPYGVAPDCVPTPEQLESFGQHVANQNAEKARRYAEFMDLKRRIIVHMGELDHVPETSFEKDVVCEDEDSFCLSRDNITSLKLLVCQLEERKAENEAACEAHREQIQRLWGRLAVPQEEREAFNEHMVTSRKSNLEVLQAEVQRLEELKLLNIRNVIDAIRSEIAVFWDKCFFSADQRQAFAAYFSEDFTEELLSLHDAEIQRLKQHHEDHKKLFDGVHQWEDSWRLYQQLEKKATDPTRFANRGGNLLKEEKQRSELHKSLPKLEKKLKAQIDAWESEQGREFFVNGEKFLQYVEDQWELHRVEKEKEKQERHLKKSKQTEEDMLYGTAVRTPTKRRLLGPQTPNKSRKLFNTTSSISSATSNSTSRSVYGGTLCRSPVPRPPLSANKGPASRTPVGGKPPNPRLQGCNKENEAQLKGSPLSGALLTPTSPQRLCSIASVASTYSEFVRDLSKASNAKIQHGILNSTTTTNL